MAPRSKFGAPIRWDLARTASSAKVRRIVTSTFSFFKRFYNLQLGVVENRCVNVILSAYFLKMHHSTPFVTVGPRKPIRVGDQKLCGIVAVNQGSGTFLAKEAMKPTYF